MADIRPTSTPAFYLQAAISFGTSTIALLTGIAYLPAPPWTRAFLAVSVLWVVTSTFTLAKCVRDEQEAKKVVSRVDDVRLQQLLAEHNPFKAPV